jgi:hypothetical protein
LTLLAGWLFADLFLVLLLMSLAGLSTRARPHSSPSKGPVPLASPSASPTPTPTPSHVQGLSRDHLDFAITLSPVNFRRGDTAQLVDEVNNQLAALEPSHRLVGFVIVFASDDINHTLRAEQTATQALQLLQSASPQFADATGLGYWNGKHNDFEFKIFFLN